MRKASKLSEVAELAGVSPITASRAIRGVGYVSEAARARIMEAAASLNYTPDMLARRMRGDKSKLIGVFVNNYGSVVLHEIIRTISADARPKGYDLIVFNAERFDRPERAQTCDMLSKLCDGVLVLLPSFNDRYLETIDQQRFPCVLVNFEARTMHVPVVAVENRIGSRIAVEHLIALGHRRIGFIAGTAGTGQSAERQKGYVEALAGAGIGFDEALCVQGAFTQTSGYSATEQLLAMSEPPTAIFAANDEMAFGAIDAVSSKGLRVPADISVIGFDDITVSQNYAPALTTMRQPREELGRVATEMLINILEATVSAPEPAHVVLASELIVRESTARIG